ncbi:hypothetical protein [Nocardia spumae]|uniref:hypothetical protein n=1 Tax=Nocardia spumae TaxID=2887190 RepID=UPI001D1503D9|nr:hypothetical protein [Nocardia spumae]
MTTVIDTSLTDRCERYRRVFHLPAAVDDASQHIVLDIGRQFGAVTMPADLGERVLRQLTQSGLVTPVVHHPRARRWTFITGPARTAAVSTTVAAELFRLYTTVACTGSQVVLPSAEDERTGYRIWVQTPDHLEAVVPMAAVVEAARLSAEPPARSQ